MNSSDQQHPDASTGVSLRLPTMKDVAVRAGVSRQLVSLVLRGAPGPSESSRELILKAAAELDFRPNKSARLLRQNRTRLIGVHFTPRNEFQNRVIERLLETSAGHGYGIVLGPVTKQRNTEVVVSQLFEHRVEALACFNPDPDSTALGQALDLMPVVWLGEQYAEPRADIVHVDDNGALRLVIRHLHDQGHRQITYAGGIGRTVGPAREAAYRQAMLESGLAAHIDVVPVGFGEEDGATAARQILERETLPTAVVASSDQCAQGILAVLREQNIAVPERVSVTGFDDSDSASLSYNRLTTVHQDVDLTVDATIKAITRRLTDRTLKPQEVATEATLVIRSTTGNANPSG
ncbi:DNA-binding LacI/PurR family transcriptional regulator [Paenarthrobacter nicotinovorans]|uniref:LacI family DNA-binding transcriptional regulator n=1 Tax=Paenarthrobacter nicotinovorans TaxID=29320 RepID=UPI0027891151|nr:LacI family DNA-binding transcriptional regulator [Paenarthrobacter nicotinovorans]MDP9933734.1 DNA-binding LacI/PurR family transcriptional regulator [Paenarthrobacter nicotinovorans]